MSKEKPFNNIFGLGGSKLIQPVYATVEKTDYNAVYSNFSSDSMKTEQPAITPREVPVLAR